MTPGTNLKPDPEGQWVRWDDVQRMADIAGQNASRLDLFHSALVDIATVPLSLPNSQAAVKRAQDVLAQAGKLFRRDD